MTRSAAWAPEGPIPLCTSGHVDRRPRRDAPDTEERQRELVDLQELLRVELAGLEPATSWMAIEVLSQLS